MKKEKTLYQVCSFCFMTLSVEMYVQSRQESGCSIELDLFRVVSKDINDIKCVVDFKQFMFIVLYMPCIRHLLNYNDAFVCPILRRVYKVKETSKTT